jgi:MFS superfamily sulfate permease-like transporter
MAKTNSFKTFMGVLPANIFAGFVVSLVALPLGLGLAIASEAPPIAGILSAVVGGVVVAVLGGSQLTIAGPGNGLVIVILSSITLLGGGDLYQGYLFTLAAVVISGILIFLFGLFRFGALSEFFPATALQGMLAAIGVGILAKQIHVMLGVTNASGGPIELLSKVPESILYIIQNPTTGVILAASMGIVSFLILILYSKIQNPLFHLVPAPMWVVFLAISLTYYYDYIAGVTYPMDKELLITLPENLLGNLPFPDFGKVGNVEFIGVVISLTLISCIESLLSIKAVDKLDPLKRRSNVNKDLRALGIATAISGLIGGLNVVTVIARSSVNVNNGGSNRSANFFHAFFLLLFILLFQDQIQRIALPALAAILVYTGYRLAAPENLISLIKIGREQAAIFLITLGMTLSYGLITGIAFGVLATFIMHVIVNKSLFLFTRNWLKPNVLMFKEEDSGNYFVSVKNFCSFLNFYKLKALLDEIPENEHAIVDFSLCEFVDHTVMEGLNDYRRSFKSKNGEFEIIGLDVHFSETKHPFAIRKVTPIKDFLSLGNNLTKRQKSLETLAKNLKWSYRPEISSELIHMEQFEYFKSKQINYQYNAVFDEFKKFELFDLSYSEGAFIAKEELKSSFLMIRLDQSVPQFILDKEHLLASLYELLGYRDIDFKEFPDFSKRFFLSGKDRAEIRRWFTPELIFFFESHSYFHIEANENTLLIKGKNRLSSIDEIKKMIAFGKELSQLIKNNTP